MKGIKKRYLFGGGIIIVAAAYLLYLSFGSSVSYYVTVSEFFERGSELHDTSVRVAGIVADSPVDWDAEELGHREHSYIEAMSDEQAYAELDNKLQLYRQWEWPAS